MNVLGIDGGGSKTVFLLEDALGTVLARFETGPSNWLSAGPDAARRALQEGIAQLPQKPDVVSAGFAGAGRPEGLAFYRDCLLSLLPQARVLIESDAVIAYAGALGTNPGILVIAGTGSIAITRTADGTMHRFGGWGPIFGDEGGGFWIGREAVRAALFEHDRGTGSDFAGAVAQQLGFSSIVDVVTAWGSGRLDTRSIAAVAATLFSRYPAEPARGILERAAAHLRTLTLNAIHRSALPEDCRKSIVGSIGRQHLMQDLVGIPFLPPLESPERGAIVLARARISVS